MEDWLANLETAFLFLERPRGSRDTRSRHPTSSQEQGLRVREASIPVCQMCGLVSVLIW